MASAVPRAAAAQQPPEPQLGVISFPTSGAAAAKPSFMRGVLYLHSFEYDSAAKQFREAQRIDPGFAMAYWGEAMTHNHPVWFEQRRDSALAVLGRLGPTAAARRTKAATERERRYLDAVEVLFGDGPKERRDTLYASAMARLSADYPDDREAAAFHALALLGTAHGGRDLPTYMRAAAIVEEVFRDNPRHPGAAHYLIHAYDDPIHAPLGLRAARAYSKIAPAAPHAQHMTSHIFIALGMWDDVVAANEVAWALSGRRSVHYGWWLAYGYLQQGRPGAARAVVDSMGASAERHGAPHGVAVRAAYLVDAPDRDAAAAHLRRHGSANLRPALVVGVELALGYAAYLKRDTAALRSSLARMEAALPTGRAAQSAQRAPSDVALTEIEAEMLRALAIRVGGGTDSAVAVLRAAAERHDALPFEFGPPPTLKPPRELLGELLLELGRPEAARREFELALNRAPRRTASLLGVARAAAAAGDSVRAARAYTELRGIWHRADPGLPELAEVTRSPATVQPSGRRVP